MQSDWDLNIKEVFKFHQALEKIKKKKILEILHIHNIYKRVKGLIGPYEMVWAPNWGVSPLTLTHRGGRLDHMRVMRPWLGGSALAFKKLELRSWSGLVRWYEPQIGGSLLSPSLVKGVNWTIWESWDPDWGDLPSPSKLTLIYVLERPIGLNENVSPQ